MSEHCPGEGEGLRFPGHEWLLIDEEDDWREWYCDVCGARTETSGPVPN